MLINFQGIFDAKKRFEMFKNNKVEMLWLHPRVSYIKADEFSKKDIYSMNSVPFQSGYLCSEILDNTLEFKEIDKKRC